MASFAGFVAAAVLPEAFLRAGGFRAAKAART